MEKEFVPYQPSLDLKELGFNEPCFGFWSSKNNYRRFINDSSTNIDLKNMFGDEAKKAPTAPTFSQAFKWFREKYKLYSQTPSTCVEESDRIFYNNPIYDELDNIVFESMEQYTTYEEAELECLKKLIEIVKEQK